MVRPAPQTVGRPAQDLQLVPRLRNDRRALDPATKSGNYLNNLLALAEARQQGATDCVMLNADGAVTEGSTSNVWALLRGTWCTPPLSAGILAGITRGLLLDWLVQTGERVAERQLTAADLQQADELFLSSSLRDIAPVTHLDGRALHGGEAGAVTSRLMPAFARFLAQRLAEHDKPYWRALARA